MSFARGVHVEMSDSSQVAVARRAAAALAERIGMDETATGKVALVSTELGTNLVRHARGGELFARALNAHPDPGVELLAIDRGPGIGNLAQALADGYSTGGSAGVGLGTIRRACRAFDVRTERNVGTLQRAVIGGGASADALGALLRPKPGEEIAGDAWASAASGAGLRLLIADGLGHGPEAAIAAGNAVRVFERSDVALESLIDHMHAQLAPTRGAAVGLAEVSADRVVFVGVGNIACRVLSARHGDRTLVSLPGTIGHERRRVQRFEHPVERGDLFVLHSDGLASQWSLAAHPGLERALPSIIAASLYRDGWRRRDDVTVLVGRVE